MAITMDIGDPADIHPTNKKDIGLRLARIALRNTYGRPDVADRGPSYVSHAPDGNKVTIQFAHVDGGLAAQGGGEPLHFEVAGKDGVFQPAHAMIAGNTVIVSSDQVAAPVNVRYAWSDAAMTNLRSGAGLPAEPFNTATK